MEHIHLHNPVLIQPSQPEPNTLYVSGEDTVVPDTKHQDFRVFKRLVDKPRILVYNRTFFYYDCGQTRRRGYEVRVYESDDGKRLIVV